MSLEEALVYNRRIATFDNRVNRFRQGLAMTRENVFTKEWVINGVNLYKKYNNSTNRKKLEDEASEFMKNGLSDSELLDYLRSDFLYWMRSRNRHEEFRSSIESSEKTILQIRKEMYEGEWSFKSIKCAMQRLCKITGVGPVLASSMLTLINPQDMGIVCQYTVKALNMVNISGYTTKRIENVADAMESIQKMQEIRTYLDKNNIMKCRMRDIDMALWGYGKNLKED